MPDSRAEFIIVLTTFPVNGNVEAFGQTLVAEKLAACVNVLPPMLSIYSWKGTLEKSDEHQLVIKTTSARRDALESRVNALHPYDTPEFLVLPILDGSPAYLAWLLSSTT